MAQSNNDQARSSLNNGLEAVLMTVEDVAATLSISESGVRRLIVSGALPSVRVGKRVLVARTALDQFIDGLINQGQAA